MIRAFAILMLLVCATAVTGQVGRETRYFHSDYDAVCGLGVDLAQGCDAIRARKILDASATPWRAIGRVNFADFDARHHCTGTLIAGDVVLTAAHCLYDADAEALLAPQSLIFVAGFQRGTFVAKSRGVSYAIDPTLRLADFADGLTPETDWALLRLDAPLGEHVGALPLAQDTAGSTAVAGYAGLRAQVLSLSSDCGDLANFRPGVRAITCPVMQGDSGAPVLVETENGWQVTGVFAALTAIDGAVVGLAVESASFSQAFNALAGF